MDRSSHWFTGEFIQAAGIWYKIIISTACTTPPLKKLHKSHGYLSQLEIKNYNKSTFREIKQERKMDQKWIKRLILLRFLPTAAAGSVLNFPKAVRGIQLDIVGLLAIVGKSSPDPISARDLM
jgi:hypothetical protein